MANATINNSATHRKNRKSIHTPIGGEPGMFVRNGTIAKSMAANQLAIVASTLRRLVATDLATASPTTASTIIDSSNSATIPMVEPARRMSSSTALEFGS